MATGTTKLTNVIDPAVFADMVQASLEKGIKFDIISDFGYDLQGNPGSTITFPTWAYIGDAVDLTEAVAMDTEVMSTTDVQAVIKETGKAVELSDTAINTGYGDPLGEASRQVGLANASKIDADIFTAVSGATLVHDVSAAGGLTFDNVVDAVAKFTDEEDETTYIFVNPAQLATIRKMDEFKKEESTIKSGVIGSIAGASIVVSNRVADAAVYLVKPGAVHVEFKAQANTESDRDILKRTTVIATTQHYACILKDASKACKITIA
jgi:N4-gp56 family major capsid protein